MSIQSTTEAILSHYGAKLASATPEQQQTLKDRVLEAETKLRVTVYWEAHRMVILGNCGSHLSRIGEWMDCSCHAFQCSGSGHENKQPCKHLVVLARWVAENIRTTGE